MTATSPIRKQKTLFPHHIVNRTQLLPDVYTLEIEKLFDFEPGQVIAIALMASDNEPRLYSIASGNKSNTIRILFDVNPTGYLTPHLSKLNTGDIIFASQPFGKFIGITQPAWFIATGTGIAPFISMIESGLGHNKTLLHGARTLDRFYFETYLSKKLNDNYLRFCTTQEAPNIIHGRLTNYLRQLAVMSPDLIYYICGSSEMVIEVREILVEQKGIPFENVIAEIYF